MRRLVSGFCTFVDLAAKRDWPSMTARGRAALWSETRIVILRRDLTEPPPRAKLPIAFSIRPYQPGDARSLFDPRAVDEARERLVRERWMRRGMARCYVATLADDRAVFMQWLCTPADNRALRSNFPSDRLEVEPNTVLLEGAYTPPRYRRLPVMPAAMARIAERGRDFGARYAVVCVEENNRSMLRAAQWAGFTPWRVKRIRRRLLSCSFRYAEASARSPQPSRATIAREPRRAEQQLAQPG
jgi:RimJ/RimL family protein N-acetyltransferase